MKISFRPSFDWLRQRNLSLNAVGHFFRRTWAIGLGFVSAALAFWATHWYAETQVAAERARVFPKGGYIEVLVAARDLGVGDRASAETIAVRRVPADWVLPNSLRPADFDAVNQQSLSQGLSAGHPLTSDHIRQRKAGASPLDLEPGYRAVSISVDEVTSVGGLIQPGDRIDLWAAALPTAPSQTSLVAISENKPPERRAQMIAENLRVLATGQRTDRSGMTDRPEPSIAYSSLTLAVPASVAALVLGGQFQGRLGIALRSGDEARVIASGGKRTGAAPFGPVEILVGGLEGGAQ
jgi:pilus assembly protein CpaB